MPVFGRPGFLAGVGLGAADSDVDGGGAGVETDGLGAGVEADGVGAGVEADGVGAGVVALGVASHLTMEEASTLTALLEPMMMVWLCFPGAVPAEISSLPA